MGLSLIEHCRQPRTQHQPAIGISALTPVDNSSVLYNCNKRSVRWQNKTYRLGQWRWGAGL